MLKLTFIGQPAFVAKRRTSNPLFVLGFSLGITFAMFVLIISGGAFLYKLDRDRTKADIERREQEVRVMTAAKDAHEKTIAYATHQLR